MKLFIGLPAAVSLTVLLAACSSSSPPSDDAGANDGSADGTTDGAGACTPVAPAAADVPTFTAPALGQGVCGTADITAFAAACGAGATGTPVATCEAWLQSMSTAACRQCLLGKNNAIGVFDSVTFSGQSTIIPSLGACILGTAGSATPSGCPAAAEPLEFCADDSCAQCTGIAATKACVTSTTSGVCAQYVSGLTSGCGAVIGMLASCESSLGTAAELTEAATVICGSGEGGPSDDGGAGEAAATEAGPSEAGPSDDAGGDGGASDDAATDSGAADSGTGDSSVTDSGKSDSGDAGTG
jgi:hypothetical protein